MTVKHPLDFVIWTHHFRGRPVPALGYDFGCWSGGRLMKLGNSKTVEMAESVIRANYTPKSVSVSAQEPPKGLPLFAERTLCTLCGDQSVAFVTTDWKGGEWRCAYHVQRGR